METQGSLDSTGLPPGLRGEMVIISTCWPASQYTGFDIQSFIPAIISHC